MISEMDTSEVVEVSGNNKYLNYSFKCNGQKLMASDGIPDKHPQYNMHAYVEYRDSAHVELQHISPKRNQQLIFVY